MKNKEDTNRIIILANLKPITSDKWHQRNDIFSKDGIMGCLTATMFKDSPRVLVRYK